MKYRDFKAAVFLLTFLKYVADGQSGVFSNFQGSFTSSSADLSLRLNFSSYNSANRTYGDCRFAFLKASTNVYTMSVNCNECSNLCLPFSKTDPSRCSEWSAWSNCSVTCGNGTKTRMKLCLGTNCTDKTEFNTSGCNAGPSCQVPTAWSDWSSWSNCSVNCGNGTQTRVRLCAGISCTAKEEFNTMTCTTGLQCQVPSVWSEWSSWSNCSVMCGNGSQTRVRLCTGINCAAKEESYTMKCNETLECQDESKQASQHEAVTDDAPNLSSGQIVIVSIVCFLMGILVTALVSIFYLKRKQQGCFSHNDKRVQAGSKKQPGPDLHVQSLTKRATANKDESEDNKNENKAVGTRYQSLDLDQLSKDQYQPMPPFDHRGNKPISGHQKQTGNEALYNKFAHNGNSTNITHSKGENVYDYARDGEDIANVSREWQASSLGQYATPTPVEDKVREIRGGQWNTDHEYLALEPVDKVRKVLGGQSDAEHEYLVLEPVVKAAS